MSHLSSTPLIARAILLAGVLLAILALLSLSHFPAYAQESIATDEIDYPEKGTHTVAAYTAMDPEGEDITWDVTGTDAVDFTIEGGVLMFDKSPDFEDPTDRIQLDDRTTQDVDESDDAGNNIYNVTVNASDGNAATMAEVTVTVTVTNMDDDGTITLTTLQPLEKIALTATLTDPDQQPGTGTATDLTDDDTTEWQWARSSSENGPWTDIEADAEADPAITSDTNSYTPGPDDVGSYLRATATYKDGHTPTDTEDPDKTDDVVSANSVLKNLVNDDPVFNYAEGDMIPADAVEKVGDEIPDGTGVEREVEENSDTDSPVGSPVAAYDDDDDTLTYTLGVTNASLFTIDSNSGQISVGAEKFNASTDTPITDGNNAETYTVTVTATDPSLAFDTITVTITVTDVDEDPSIDEGNSSVVYEENADTQVAATYTATDPEDTTPADLEWSLSGLDRDKFTIGNTDSDRGELTFKESPDFEAPSDRGGNNVYNVTVEVTDSGDNTDSRNVTVTIGNAEETGMITMSNLQPEAGTPITAELTDPDRVSGSVTWEWGFGSDTVTLTGSLSSTYTPLDAHGGITLRVTANYADRHGAGKSATNTLSNAVQPDGLNTNPKFLNSDNEVITAIDRMVAENTAADVDIGGPVAARDDEDDNLTYSLYRGDVSSFEIDRSSGQLTTKAALDFERKSRYQVSVRATDPTRASATVTVTINVTDVEEKPSIAAGGATIEYQEITNLRPNMNPVFTYTATDPEDDNARPRKPLTWSLAGTDALHFSIEGGVLRFRSPPDYENPADSGGGNVYNVDVIVTDNLPGDDTDSKPVIVTVTNVDEDGKVTLSTLQPLEKIALTATLTDPDQQHGTGTATDLTDDDTTEWQWARSSSENGPWTDIEADAEADPAITSDTNSYTPGPDDVGSYLRATATYKDGHTPTDTEDPDKTDDVVSANSVLKNLVNDDPVFNYAEGDMIPADAVEKVGDEIPDGTGVEREVEENSDTNSPVGSPVAAYDDDDDTLTYTLGVTNASLFTIDSNSGQISVGAEKFNASTDTPITDGNNAETYTVTVTATDPSLAFDTITVTITVTNVDENPSIGEGGATIEYLEIKDSSANIDTVFPYEADDDEDDQDSLVLDWSLSGADSDKFMISNDASTRGQLTFKSPPDFEAPADSGRNNVYNVTVIVTDSDDMTDSRDVAVTVTNVEEAGTVTLSNLQPEDRAPITATLKDPDGGETGVTWQWAYPESGNDPRHIVGATSATYTPVSGDVGNTLRAIATYTDNAINKDDPDTDGVDESEMKDTKESVPVNPVQAHDDMNEPPAFPDQDEITLERQTDQTRYVLESANATDPVVLDEDGDPLFAPDDDPVTAKDEVTSPPDGPNGDILTYTLGGPDAAFFTIDTIDDPQPDPDKVIGQIRVGTETKLDYETKDTYTVTVTATDPSLASDTITVTIKVVDVDEEPVVSKSGLGITGENSIDYAEDRTDAVATYMAAGQAAPGARWSLGGDDAGDFSISSGGVLTFRSTPNFENPTDQGGNNVYNVMVKATSGAIDATLAVTVTVGNLEEDGSVTLSSDQDEVKVDVTITAEVTDLDVVTPNTVTWQWARASSATASGTPISGATAATYTPVEADVDSYLRATASYTDGHGPNKSEDAVTGDVVEAVITVVVQDGSVNLSPSQLVVGDVVTAILSDPDSDETDLAWQWARSSDGSTGWTDIVGATSQGSVSATYTTVDDDAGNYLRATVTYTDSDGPDNTASGVTANAVNAATTTPIHKYDSNGDGIIQRDEVFAAIRAFLFEKTASRDEVLEVIRLHLGL